MMKDMLKKLNSSAANLNFMKQKAGKKLPVQDRCMILDAWGWCTEMTQKDGIGREEGRGFRIWNMCIPVVDSC